MNNSKNCWTVYCHTTPSGKRYIGITSQKPEKRWSNGNGYIKDTPFGKAIEKYGWDNIKHEILDTDLDEFTAKCLEEYYIFSFHTFVGFSEPKGYNCTLGGDGCVGYVPTEEHKRKLSESHKGVHPSDETRRKMSNSQKGNSSHKGHHHSEETKRRISEKLKGKPLPEETRIKISESTKGKKGISPSEESRRKNSEAHKGKTPWNKGLQQSEESRRKNSEAHKGKKHTEESKHKISETMKGRPSNTKGRHLVMVDGKRTYVKK